MGPTCLLLFGTWLLPQHTPAQTWSNRIARCVRYRTDSLAQGGDWLVRRVVCVGNCLRFPFAHTVLRSISGVPSFIMNSAMSLECRSSWSVVFRHRNGLFFISSYHCLPQFQKKDVGMFDFRNNLNKCFVFLPHYWAYSRSSTSCFSLLGWWVSRHGRLKQLLIINLLFAHFES